MPFQSPTYAEYLQAIQAANDAVTENSLLRQRIGELEERVQAAELTPEHMAELSSAHLTRLAHHYHALLAAVIEELRARHHDVAEELIEPQIRALEEALAAAKQRAWEARAQLRECQQENTRIMAVREKIADVQTAPEQALEPGGTR